MLANRKKWVSGCVILLVFVAFVFFQCAKNAFLPWEPVALSVVFVAAVVFLSIGLPVLVQNSLGIVEYDPDTCWWATVFVMMGVVLLALFFLWMLLFRPPLLRRKVPQ